MPDLTPLERVISTYHSMLVGFSGGVDSALLAVAGRKVLGKDKCVAALGCSPSLARLQRRRARDLALEFDLELLEVNTGELDDPSYAANPTNRCYFCKRELWSVLVPIARERGLEVIADGTNKSDLGGHRPGRAAAVEVDVRSPLVESGYSKARVRAEARALGIPIWNAPSSPCLSSRIQFGLEVTPARLRQVEDGEDILRSMGVAGDLRVRHRGDEARIEVLPAEFEKVRSGKDRIAVLFAELGFERVTLDLKGYRSGSLLAAGTSDLELISVAG
ncbi:MAG: ATP-dependent sacrificial sulfur transferase LarE [Gemmatimonadetes bacterium]|nr:ATP-dependent sacrificial sulfur transferase LarE [Gemmatimonadota bacterium]